MLWETVFKIYSVKGQEQQSNKEKVEWEATYPISIQEHKMRV